MSVKNKRMVTSPIVENFKTRIFRDGNSISDACNNRWNMQFIKSDIQQGLDVKVVFEDESAYNKYMDLISEFAKPEDSRINGEKRIVMIYGKSKKQ